MSATSKKGSATASTPAKVEIKSKSKDVFFHRYQTSIYSGLGGFLAGNVTGGIGGYWFGGRNTVSAEELSKANAKITELEQKLNAFSNAQSTIETLKNEKQKVNALTAQNSQKDNEINSLKASLGADGDQKNKQIISLNTQLTSKTSEANDLKNENNNLKNEVSNLKKSTEAIKAIFGDEDANNLTAKKDELAKMLKIGKIWTCTSGKLSDLKDSPWKGDDLDVSNAAWVDIDTQLLKLLDDDSKKFPYKKLFTTLYTVAFVAKGLETFDKLTELQKNFVRAFARSVEFSHQLRVNKLS